VSARRIKPVLYIYIKYQYPDPWIKLSAKSIKLLSELGAEISMEVVSVSSAKVFE
jgi:hypothetical protein